MFNKVAFDTFWAFISSFYIQTSTMHVQLLRSQFTHIMVLVLYTILPVPCIHLRLLPHAIG